MIESFPRTTYEKTTFANGLRLLTSSMPHTHSVAVSIYIGAGSRYETPDLSGVSHFIEHMCFKGTRKRPTAQLISETIDGVGGMLNAATDREFTVFYAKVARPHLELALDVLSDLVLTPLFDPREFEKERKVVLEELASVADSPAQQADLLLDSLLWPGQPLGWDVAGRRESVEALSRERAVGYLMRQYVPNNTVVSVAGNVQHHEVVELLQGTLGSVAKGEPGPWFPAEDGQEAPRCSVLYKRTEQTHIAMGLRGIPLAHPHRYALDLLSVLFGEGMSSRLFLELRERQGLCYEVNTYVSHFLDTGCFGLYAAVDPSKGRVAVKALVSELQRLREGIPEDELRKAKELAKGRLLLRMEDTRAVSGWLGSQEILLGQVLSPEEVVGRIDSVTTYDMQRVIHNILRKDQVSLAVVGPYRSEGTFLPLLDL
jgi:predicted Zn-dependent peptidase